MRPIILSIQPRWADLIQSGAKTIELRKRFPPYLSGSDAFIYVSSPRCTLSAIVKLGMVHELSVDDLWERYGKASCVNEPFFRAYFDGRQVGFGIEVSAFRELDGFWPLDRLRSAVQFTAPQSWAYASPQLQAEVGARA